ncbi:tetratricopeptide repeat protein [Arundinibacter roseus]|uniref:Tetratricopeptide repeat protein n=1 Tax=Arundinibacter roseus TaxID=2070510 RepID=A0A4R4KA58_9BACT|nr:tetratricopeptide repeat protein [Arundinibacter roseus]TDB64650.1 tetratricopeptide repeat protein [Arundinibacter roseus]
MKLLCCRFSAILWLFITNFSAFQTLANEPEVPQIFTQKLQLAYFEIQKLRLEKARLLLGQEKNQTPENPAIVYLENYADMYYLLISEDKAAFERLGKQQDLRLEKLDKLPASSPYKRFLKAEIRLHWAFIKLKFGNEVSASWDIIKAYRLLEENQKMFPTFLPTLKSLGLLHVLIGSVPEQYSWVTRILGLSGNINQGIRELRLVQQKEPLFRQEAELIDLLLHAYTLQLDHSQIRLLKNLPDRQPDNLLIHFFATSVLMKEGRSEEALRILTKAPRTAAHISFPFLDYLLAEIQLQKGEYEVAYTNYSKFQKSFKGFNFLKDSYFKQFLCRWLTGQDAQAKARLALLPKVGETIVESDQYAAKFASMYTSGKVKAEQKILFEARYASDGGFLEQASEVISKVSEVSFAEESNRAEFNYRKGRILQKMKEEEQALVFFERALQLAQKSGLYYAPSSALQMGYIYKEKNQKNLAIAFFKKAMSFKKHEYKNSIDNKARAALTELGA